MKHPSSLFLIVLFPMFLWGQEPASPSLRKFQICGFHVAGGPIHAMNYASPYKQFEAVATNTEILTKHPFEGYRIYPTAYWNHSVGMTAALGFRLIRQDDPATENGPLFRLGLRYNGASHQFLNANRSDYFPLDTLYNGQGVQIGYVDSVVWQRYSMKYNAYQLHLDLSMIFSTSTRHRVSLFGGLGITAGVSTRAWVQISHRNSSFRETMIQDMGSSNHWQTLSSDDYDYEKENTSGNTAGVVYLPMGLKVKLGKKGGLAEHLQLFYELQPGIQMMHIKGSDTFLSTGVHQSTGFIVNW